VSSCQEMFQTVASTRSVSKSVAFTVNGSARRGRRRCAFPDSTGTFCTLTVRVSRMFLLSLYSLKGTWNSAQTYYTFRESTGTFCTLTVRVSRMFLLSPYSPKGTWNSAQTYYTFRNSTVLQLTA
jgi:hypothetical protein